MAERELIIRYVVQNESRGFADAEKARLKSVADAADKAAKQQAASAAKAAKDSERSWAKAEADRLREFKRIQAERDREAKRSAREEERQARELARGYERINRENLRDFQRVQREKIKAQRDAEREAQRSAAAQAKAMKEANEAAKGSGSLVSSLKQVAAGYIGISMAAKGLEFLNTSWESYNQTIKRGVADLKSYREEVQELANLKDRLGNTTSETREQLVYRAKTLQSRQAAIAYQEGYFNTSQAAVASKAISKAESDRLMILGGSYQAAAGGSADTQGNFLGGLPAIMARQGKGAVTADAAFNKFGQVRKILAEGGSGENQGFAQLLTNSAYTSTGLYRDIAQQAALQSMFSTSSPQTAGTLVDQFTRATVGGLGKMRGQGVEGGEKLNTYLKGVGATETMDPIQIGRLISRDLVTQRAAAKAKGEEFSDYGYLSRHGYTEQETRDAILQFSAKEQSGSLDAFLGMAGGAGDATEINQRVKGFQAADPLAKARSVELAKDLSSAAIASGPQETYNQLKEAAFNLVQAENPKYFSGTFDEWDKNGAYNAIFKRPVIDKLAEITRGEAARVGASLPTKNRAVSMGGLGGGRVVADDQLSYGFLESSTSIGDQQNVYGEAATRIGAAGGDIQNAILQRIAELAERQLQATMRSERAIREGQGKKGPVAKPAAGNVGRN